MERREYVKNNLKFKDKCSFFIGRHKAGFFSEINVMLCALIYCYNKKIKFTLHYKPDYFASKKGWEEYFEPFCPVNYNKLLNKYNYRDISQADLKKIKKYNNFNNIMKFLFGYKYLNYEVSHFYFSSIGKKEFSQISQKEKYDFANMLWQFNSTTKSQINKIENSLNLPNNYISLQIRRGDKWELEQVEPPKLDFYMDYIKKEKFSIKDIFIFCDDYNDFQYLKNNYSDFNFYTLCSSKEKGYINEDFQKLDWKTKKRNIIKLFANIEIMRKSDFCLGTIIANPSFFLDWLMEEKKFLFVEKIMSLPN